MVFWGWIVTTTGDDPRLDPTIDALFGDDELMFDDILQDIARRSAQRGTLPDPTPEFLREVWPAMVGESLARLSEPVQLLDRSLLVAVRHRKLVREWKSTPLPLLQRIRRFCPWPVETLEIEYDAEAAALGPADGDAGDDQIPDSIPARPPVDDDQSDGIDDELRALIDSIDRHRRADGDD